MGYFNKKFPYIALSAVLFFEKKQQRPRLHGGKIEEGSQGKLLKQINFYLYKNSIIVQARSAKRDDVFVLVENLF